MYIHHAKLNGKLHIKKSNSRNDVFRKDDECHTDIEHYRENIILFLMIIKRKEIALPKPILYIKICAPIYFDYLLNHRKYLELKWRIIRSKSDIKQMKIRERAESNFEYIKNWRDTKCNKIKERATPKENKLTEKLEILKRLSLRLYEGKTKIPYIDRDLKIQYLSRDKNIESEYYSKREYKRVIRTPIQPGLECGKLHGKGGHGSAIKNIIDFGLPRLKKLAFLVDPIFLGCIFVLFSLVLFFPRIFSERLDDTSLLQIIVFGLGIYLTTALIVYHLLMNIFGLLY